MNVQSVNSEYVRMDGKPQQKGKEASDFMDILKKSLEAPKTRKSGVNEGSETQKQKNTGQKEKAEGKGSAQEAPDGRSEDSAVTSGKTGNEAETAGVDKKPEDDGGKTKEPVTDALLMQEAAALVQIPQALLAEPEEILQAEDAASLNQNPTDPVPVLASAMQAAEGIKTDGQIGSAAQGRKLADAQGAVLEDSDQTPAVQAENAAAKAGQAGNAGNQTQEWTAMSGQDPGEPVSYQDMLKARADQMKSMASGNTRSTEEGTPSEKASAVDADDLQKKVNEGVYLPPVRTSAMADRYEAPAVDNSQMTPNTPLAEQLRGGIEQGMARGLNQFTIRLKPEGLGEIVIHMVSAGGKIAMSIGVSNSETQRMLNSEMLNLREALQPLHAEVEEIYQNSQGGLDFMNYQQDLNRQQWSMDQQGTGRFRHGTFVGEETEEASGEVQQMHLYTQQQAMNRLYAYI